MSFVTAARQTLKRPLISSIFAVGVALLVSCLIADPRKKPTLTRKMHIESIPMCKLYIESIKEAIKVSMLAANSTLQGRERAITMPTVSTVIGATGYAHVC